MTDLQHLEELTKIIKSMRDTISQQNKLILQLSETIKEDQECLRKISEELTDVWERIDPDYYVRKFVETLGEPEDFNDHSDNIASGGGKVIPFRIIKK